MAADSTSVAPITLFVREEADWMSPHNPADTEPESRGLSDGARQVQDFLRQRGASFFADIVRGTGKLKAEIETGLWELVAAGIAHGRWFREFALPDRSQAATRGGRRPIGAPSAQRRGVGHCFMPMKLPTAPEPLRATCWMLSCARYGVVFRDLLARRNQSPQVARDAAGLPAAGRSLGRFAEEDLWMDSCWKQLARCRLRWNRFARREELAPTGESITLSAADPLNLVGILGARGARPRDFREIRDLP